MEKILYSKFSNQRAAEFCIRTDIVQRNEKRFVRKVPSGERSREHIIMLKDKFETLKKCFKGTRFQANVGILYGDTIEFEYIEGDSYERILDKELENYNIPEFYKKIEDFVSEVYKVYTGENFVSSDEFETVFGKVELSKDVIAAKGVNIDLVFSNVLVKDDVWNVIDYEWTFEFLIPINYLVWRAIWEYMNFVDVRAYISEEDLFQRLKISKEEVCEYEKMERHFQQKYCCKNTENILSMQKNWGEKIVSAKDVFGLVLESESLGKIQIYYDYGEGYTEENSAYVLSRENEGKIHNVKFEVNSKLKNIRIDPSPSACIVKICHFFGMLPGEEKYKLEYISNGKEVGNNTIIFLTDDPQIYFTNLKDYTEKIELVYQIIGFSISNIAQELSFHRLFKEMSERIEEQKRDIDMQEKRLQEKEKEIREKSAQILNRDTQIREKDLQILEKDRYIQNLNMQWDAVINSDSWRITKPLRSIGESLRKNRYTYLIGKGLKSLKGNGISITYKKTKNKIKKYLNRIENTDRIVIPFPEDVINNNEKIILQIPNLEQCNKEIVVHTHLFYEDLLNEMLGYVNLIPYMFDLIITCQMNANTSRILGKAKKIKNARKVEVIPCENRGRDIAPLYAILRKKIEGYDYFLHIHSKKSLYTGTERVGWRQYSLSSLLGSEELVKKIFSIFENEPNVGIICPDNHEDVPMLAYAWLANESVGRQLLDRLQVPFRNGIFMYPAGSFFWARTQAVLPLFEANFQVEDFPEECGQTDGTLAHALERALGLVVQYHGFRQIFVDYQEGVFRYDMSMKAFRRYLEGLSLTNMLAELDNYEVISFDIFDTLISRNVLYPDDVFRIIERRLEEEYNEHIDFVVMRKQAEANVWESKGAYTNIHDIYIEFSKIVGLSQEICDKIKYMEINLEYKLSIPRYDMLCLYNELKKKGKKIILVSDMYLTKDIIASILKKCGYKDYDCLWVSCESGLRKDQGRIWSQIFREIDEKTFIHIGDNPQADWQTLVDQRKNVWWIFNPRDAWSFSECYEKTIALNDDSLEYSIVAGMLVNGALYNSPFSLNQWRKIVFNDAKQVGYAVFGPIFYEFIVWVQQNTKKDAVLAFLAREGYILQQIYDIIYGNTEDEKENCYFLASRRATGVAGVESWEDVRELLSKDYKGNLGDLLDIRLGIKFTFPEKDESIFINGVYQQDVEKVMGILEKYKAWIMEQLALEKQTYISYVKSIVSKDRWKDIVVIDVGYSGTIQYFLAKMLDEKVKGCYLAMFGETKPDKIGCICEGMYGYDDSFGKVIHKTQLFLEAVLEAPYGQLIRFEEGDKGVQAIYKPQKIVSEEILSLQEGMLDYCRIRRTLQGHKHLEWGAELIRNFCENILGGEFLTDKLSMIFKVEDDYCSSTTLRYDNEKGEWK